MRKEIDIMLAGAIVGLVLIVAIGISMFVGYAFFWSKYDTRSQQEKDKAKFALEVTRNRKSSNNYVDLGWSYYEEGKWGKAMHHYQEALKQNPDNIAAWYNLGLVNLQLNNFKEAEECLKKSIFLNKRHELAYYCLGQLYNRLGRYDEAADNLKTALALSPASANFMYELGTVYERKKMYSEAWELYKKAVSFVPDYREALDGLSRIEAGGMETP